MTYFCSTRGGQKEVNFEDVVRSGYATDGGMYMPHSIPKLDLSLFLDLLETQHITERKDSKMKSLSGTKGLYQRVALEIFSLFVFQNEISPEELKQLVETSFSSDIFPNEEGVLGLAVSPDDIHFAELFYGPTMAFKDLGLSFLGNILSHFLQRNRAVANIVVATSGDTGSAAIHAVKGKKNINLFVLYPIGGRISKLQELQMTTAVDYNIYPIGIDGTSDDADVPLRRVFEDLEFREKRKLCSINSINWCRIMVQIVHYVVCYLKIMGTQKVRNFVQQNREKKNGEEEEEREIDQDHQLVVSIPCGAWGNLTAGLIARKMGVPLKFVVATNKNDVLHKFIQEGCYRPLETPQATNAPAMDIAAPYNVERVLWLLFDGDAVRVQSCLTNLEKNGEFFLEKKDLELLQSWIVASESVQSDEVVEEIKRWHDETSYLLCPHSAIGVRAARLYRQKFKGQAICSILTAHAAKFPETISLALGKEYVSPLSSLVELPTSSLVFPGNKDDWEKHLRELIVVASKRWIPSKGVSSSRSIEETKEKEELDELDELSDQVAVLDHVPLSCITGFLAIVFFVNLGIFVLTLHDKFYDLFEEVEGQTCGAIREEIFDF